jgi:hypothetical protein
MMAESASRSPMSSAPVPPENTNHDGQQATPPDAPKAVGATQPDAPLAGEVTPRVAQPSCGNCHVLTLSVLSLCLIGLGVTLFYAWSGYREKYAQATEGWRVGGTRMVELTLIKQDKQNLACASDLVREGLHCAYRANLSPFGSGTPDDPHVMVNYNTIKNELFLGAGLWSNPVMQQALPNDRFTVVCNYHVVGVIKSVSLRWSPTGAFGPVGQSVTLGTLTECVIPQ